jgi:hypothetical protein
MCPFKAIQLILGRIKKRNFFHYGLCYGPPEREPGKVDKKIFKQQSVHEV